MCPMVINTRHDKDAVLVQATLLGDTLMNAVGKWLENNRSPGRKVKQIDNR
jgi:monomeric isocitrate dehydrogenase